MDGRYMYAECSNDANKKVHTFGLVVHAPLSAWHGSVKLCNPNHISIMHTSLYQNLKIVHHKVNEKVWNEIIKSIHTFI